jgi:hypothetical protein
MIRINASNCRTDMPVNTGTDLGGSDLGLVALAQYPEIVLFGPALAA